MQCYLAIKEASQLEVKHKAKLIASKMYEGELGALQMQLQQITEGGGICSYLLVNGCPLAALTVKVALLNACPIYRLWFSFNEYVFGNYGHSYHPWCLAYIILYKNSVLFLIVKLSLEMYGLLFEVFGLKCTRAITLL